MPPPGYAVTRRSRRRPASGPPRATGTTPSRIPSGHSPDGADATAGPGAPEGPAPRTDAVPDGGAPVPDGGLVGIAGGARYVGRAPIPPRAPAPAGGDAHAGGPDGERRTGTLRPTCRPRNRRGAGPGGGTGAEAAHLAADQGHSPAPAARLGRRRDRRPAGGRTGRRHRVDRDEPGERDQDGQQPSSGAWVGRTVAGPVGTSLRESAFEFTVYRLDCPPGTGGVPGDRRRTQPHRPEPALARPCSGRTCPAGTGSAPTCRRHGSPTPAPTRSPTPVPAGERMIVPLVFAFDRMRRRRPGSSCAARSSRPGSASTCPARRAPPRTPPNGGTPPAVPWTGDHRPRPRARRRPRRGAVACPAAGPRAAGRHGSPPTWPRRAGTGIRSRTSSSPTTRTARPSSAAGIPAPGWCCATGPAESAPDYRDGRRRRRPSTPRRYSRAAAHSVAWIRTLLAPPPGAAPQFGCFGLHEWAMVYRQPAESSAPRLAAAARPAADRRGGRGAGSGARHFDAYRFFTPAARPLNPLGPTRESQADLEQPGCLHANMDLYKWAYKLSPAGAERTRGRLLRPGRRDPGPGHARQPVRPGRPRLRAGPDRDARGPGRVRGRTARVRRAGRAAAGAPDRRVRPDAWAPRGPEAPVGPPASLGKWI